MSFLKLFHGKKRGLIWSFRTFLESALYAHQFHGFAKGGEWTISVRNNDTSREIIVHLTIFDRVSNVYLMLLRYMYMPISKVNSVLDR